VGRPFRHLWTKVDPYCRRQGDVYSPAVTLQSLLRSRVTEHGRGRYIFMSKALPRRSYEQLPWLQSLQSACTAATVISGVARQDWTRAPSLGRSRTRGWPTGERHLQLKGATTGRWFR
jgi:hypothetical protein